MRFILTFLASYSCLFGLAQTGNHTIVAKEYSLSFDIDNNVVFSKGQYDAYYPWWASSNYDGSLKYYCTDFARNSIGQVFNGRGYPKNYGLNFCQAKLTDSTTLIFENNKDTCSSYICSLKLCKSLLQSSGSVLFIDTANFRKTLLPQNTFGICTIEDTSGGTWLLVRVSSTTFYNYYFSNHLDYDTMVVSTVPQLYSPILDNLSDTTLSNWNYNWLEPSPSGNLISVFYNQNTQIPNVSPLDEWVISHLLRFDKSSGQLTHIKEVFNLNSSMRFFGTASYINYWVYTPGEFTSDDQWYYFSYERHVERNQTDSSFLFRYNILDERMELIAKMSRILGDSINGGTSEVQDWKLMNNRELFMYRLGIKDGKWGHTFGVIENPNEQELTINYHKYFLETYPNISAPMSRSKYNYINVKPQYSYDCMGHVQFRDWCDYSLPNTKVSYFSEAVAGSGELVPRGENPIMDYAESGSYLCKVILTSKEGTYKEIHYDTLRVRIPNKPVTLFEAKDTVVCAYSKASFYNLCNADTINATNGEKWEWTFGDGTSRTYNEFQQVINHVYEKPGNYTVSLFYSNGFCDSTLVKNQYIRVVDAPKPGFDIDNNRGCTPFTVNIKDTVTYNTTKKEYNFYDGRGWKDIVVNQGNFSHTYNRAGNYWITQRLYGYTGCVTQEDSVRIYVTAGITKNDTLHLQDATYRLHPSSDGALVIAASNKTKWRGGKEPIDLMWYGHSAAVAYQINKNGEALAKVSSVYTAYTDSVQMPDIFEYSVSAIDSCGNNSSIGRKAHPIYLYGEAAENNKLAVLQFSPYIGAQNEIDYKVLVEVENAWVELSTLGKTTTYTDLEYLKMIPKSSRLQLEKCYIIETANIYSNVLCMHYQPIVFLPTAFSPNNDGLNDTYRPITFGIENYEMSIYDKWGGKLATFTDKDQGWDASNVPLGVYTATLQAKGTDNRWYVLAQSVTVIR